MSESIKASGKLSICFVALDNFAALVDDPKFGHIGGAEMQQILIGRNLAKRGYRVSFITRDHGQDDEIEIDGMCITKVYDQNKRISVLRFLHPKLTNLWHAMKRANADIYYQRTSDGITGIVATFCRLYHRKFIFAVAHDHDCVTTLPHCSARHERVLYRYGLRWASLIIAQTITQQKLLRENFGLGSTVIPNCAPDYGSRLGGSNTPVSARGRRLLWVGAFKPAKRLELLFDIAEQHQDLQFDVVGDSNKGSDYVQRLRSRGQTLPNVTLHGMVPHARMQVFYQRSAALICTSRAEGFPNIFLEAWAQGLPVVSTFDPDNLIADRDLGIVARDAKGLVSGIRTLLADLQRWQGASHTARRYYLENHTIEAVMPRFENVFKEVMNTMQSVGLKK